MLQKKKVRLDRLVRQRILLEKRLSQLEGRIIAIGGVIEKRRKPRGPRRRQKNPKTLIVEVLEVLSQYKKGMPLKELAQKLLEGGYKTTSTNFLNTLYQCIYHNSEKLIHDSKTHTYRLK